MDREQRAREELGTNEGPGMGRKLRDTQQPKAWQNPTDRSLTPWTRCTLEKRVW